MKMVSSGVMAIFFGLITPCVVFSANPKIWVAFNGTWGNQVVTHTPQTVASLVINKQEDTSTLKVSFSGGRLSFQADASDLNAQAVFEICIDGQAVAKALNFDSVPGFRNQYPSIMTAPENLPKGQHTFSFNVYTTDNPGEGGILTYATTLGTTPNTYKAQLIVEEWPVNNPAGALPAYNLLLE
ncbi:MAG: hypothetical protein L6277_13400 [Desulfobacterales bacterium]|nr:hypothetical protein [Pseudomonadota bacterium]MBU4354377.1 hypothetical protein [Pseudomonadota bacterium]MCG2773067.1 hypothetical protein [Desulfobacterales bacterium]